MLLSLDRWWGGIENHLVSWISFSYWTLIICHQYAGSGQARQKKNRWFSASVQWRTFFFFLFLQSHSRQQAKTPCFRAIFEKEWRWRKEAAKGKKTKILNVMLLGINNLMQRRFRADARWSVCAAHAISRNRRTNFWFHQYLRARMNKCKNASGPDSNILCTGAVVFLAWHYAWKIRTIRHWKLFTNKDCA